MSQTQETQDHHIIKNWVQERNGEPCVVEKTDGDDETGILKISFGQNVKDLKPISWEKFFDKFDKENLKFIYQNENNYGSLSQFNKLVNA